MGFRFQRRIKIAPGISLNLSKSGVSTSIGPRGAKVTLGHGKVRTTIGVPGTGLSYTEWNSLQGAPAASEPSSNDQIGHHHSGSAALHLLWCQQGMDPPSSAPASSTTCAPRP